MLYPYRILQHRRLPPSIPLWHRSTMLLGMARIRAYQQARRWSGRRAHQAGHALAKNKSTGIYLVHGAGDVGHGPPRSSGRPACALAPCTPEEQEEQQENATPHTLPHPRVSPQIAQCKPRDIAAYMTGIAIFFATQIIQRTGGRDPNFVNRMTSKRANFSSRRLNLRQY